jgi:hypothetical protein
VSRVIGAGRACMRVALSGGFEATIAGIAFLDPLFRDGFRYCCCALPSWYLVRSAR